MVFAFLMCGRARGLVTRSLRLCIKYCPLQVDDLMSQEILLASDSSSHHSLPIITSSIKEVRPHLS